MVFLFCVRACMRLQVRVNGLNPQELVVGELGPIACILTIFSPTRALLAMLFLLVPLLVDSQWNILEPFASVEVVAFPCTSSKWTFSWQHL